MGGQVSLELDANKEVSFFLGDKKHTINANSGITPLISLNTYLRQYAGLRDTKNMCREGGCGACIVAVSFEHPVLRRKRTLAVNSCLIPVLACHNWQIETVHGIGNRQKGYHPIQETLAKYSGSQCGFCSGGMVMNMYALMEENDMLTQNEIENSFGGNMCRCTGYRPILDAFKSLASDADQSFKNEHPDIEDIRNIKICSKTGQKCDNVCKITDRKPIILKLENGMSWYKMTNLQDILTLFQNIGTQTYTFVAGNTGHGVYQFNLESIPENWIDIQYVTELISYQQTTNLVLGANMSLTDSMSIMKKLAAENNNFWYLNQAAIHLDRIANVPVRNMGTLAGNLSLKHDHHEFPSDIFMILETIQAQITIVQQDGTEVQKTPADYINFDMNKCIMKTITIFPIDKDTHFFGTYKICPRVQNAHAYVNAGFLIEHDTNNVVVSARIVYGGINPNFIHASKTEAYLTGKNLFDNATIQGALATLTLEIEPDYVLPDATPEFRKDLTRNLFYKFVLSNAPTSAVNPKFASGAANLFVDRPLSSGVQLYTTDESMYPVTQPVQKIEGLAQCSGEAEYIDDMPAMYNEAFGSFVLAEAEPNSHIDTVDLSEAKIMPGYITYVDYKDIPGVNAFSIPLISKITEKLFCIDVVEYNGQPIGVVVCETEMQANFAAAKVKITYTKSQSPLVPEYTIQSVLDHKRIDKIIPIGAKPATARGFDTKKVIKGDINIKGQYHYHMETQRCICIPKESGEYDLYPSTQFVAFCQYATALVLGIPASKIHITVKRCGGAFGGKSMRSAIMSTACSVVAHKVQRPVRLLLSLPTNMKAIGKRFTTLSKYELGIDENANIQYLENTVYQATGLSGANEELTTLVPIYMTNLYKTNRWNILANLVLTDMAGNAWARGPGTFEANSINETIMDHIAYLTGKDPADVRKQHLLNDSEDKQLEFFEEVITWTDYYNRLKDINDFNNKNRWQKRGLGIALMNYRIDVFFPFTAVVSVSAVDGTVDISHGGVEIGQGINTKAAQVCAYKLQIDMSMITIRPTSSAVNPNNFATGASIASEGVCCAIMKACDRILNVLKPIRDKMNNPTWPELIQEAYKNHVNLSASDIFTALDESGYNVIGGCVVQVLVDMLTGEHIIERADLLEDAGKSMSPLIDIGQIEGAFMMGLGNHVHENIQYGSNGEILTYNTWNYKIPGAKDIPVDFRVKMRFNSSNPKGILNSKATGEPAITLSVCVPLAIRRALAAAKKDAGQTKDLFVKMDGPTTVEYTLLNASSDYKTFTL